MNFYMLIINFSSDGDGICRRRVCGSRGHNHDNSRHCP